VFWRFCGLGARFLLNELCELNFIFGSAEYLRLVSAIRGFGFYRTDILVWSSDEIRFTLVFNCPILSSIF
jgi:hypothetical protein